MIKVIHCILGKSNPDRMNGVNKVVNNLATVQIALGKEVEVWGITNDPKGEIAKLAYPIHLFQAHKNKFKLDAELQMAIKALDPKQTVFHIHGTFITEFVHVTALLRKCQIPYIITSHGTFNFRALGKGKWRKKIFFWLFDHKVVKGAKAMHFIGQSEYDAFEDKLKGANKVLIPNGQNFEELTFDFTSLKEKKELVFGFCGRMKKNVKGLDLLLNGFALYLKQSSIETKLWFVGDGDEVDEVKGIVSDLKLEGHVKFWGSKFGEEKCNIIANMDVFFHTSRYEGLPGAVLEASSLKVPCVVSQETNMAAYVKDNNAGLSLPENSPIEISKAMLDMAKDWEEGILPQKGANALKMIKENFDWKVIAEKLQKVYES